MSFNTPIIHPRPWMLYSAFIIAFAAIFLGIVNGHLSCSVNFKNPITLFNLFFCIFGGIFTFIASKIDPEFNKSGGDNIVWLLFSALIIVLPSLLLSNEVSYLLEADFLAEFECKRIIDW